MPRHKPGAIIPVYPSEKTADLAERGPYDIEKGIRGGPLLDGAGYEPQEIETKCEPVDPMYNQTKWDLGRFQHATHPWKPKGRKS